LYDADNSYGSVHLVQPNAPTARWRKAQNGYAGKLIVGEDLMEFGVGSKSR
jgi:hypothetical protein